jgi:hypothetical protein
MMPKLHTSLLLYFILSYAHSQSVINQVDEMKLRSVIIRSSISNGSAFIAHTVNDWHYAFTAKHVVPQQNFTSDSVHFFSQLYNSEDSIPCEIIYRDPDLDFAILRFQASLDLPKNVVYDTIPNINTSFHLISAINEWTMRPLDERKAQLISLATDKVKQKIYMTGLDSGDSGSGFFSEKGFFGIVWLKEGDIIHAIASEYMVKKLNLILEESK